MHTVQFFFAGITAPDALAHSSAAYADLADAVAGVAGGLGLIDAVSTSTAQTDDEAEVSFAAPSEPVASNVSEPNAGGPYDGQEFLYSSNSSSVDVVGVSAQVLA